MTFNSNPCFSLVLQMQKLLRYPEDTEIHFSGADARIAMGSAQYSVIEEKIKPKLYNALLLSGELHQVF